ncbi:MAG: hldE [Parachlamydiales bacterium]|nr:hldE [Parachlamydiales bacterium]
MVKLAGTLSHFQPIQAIVIGDFMLDKYTTGRVKRISPEAPVPVMEVEKQESRPGGAGNVVLNLTALGAKVFALGRIGFDFEGEQLKSSLSHEGVVIQGLLSQKEYQTPVKNRLIADSQQLLRVDFETISPIHPAFEENVIWQLKELLPQAKVVAISDYGKGFLTESLIAETIRWAKKYHVPVIVDPKGIDFAKYKGATILKPNQSEAYAAARLGPHAELDAVAQKILEIADVDHLLITRSEAGISLFDRSRTRQDFPVRSREVKDVTGAGDTVLAILSAAMANGLDIRFAAQLANIAAGIAIERLGCAQITISDLARRLLEYDTDTKIFDDSHTYALRQVLKDKSYSLLVLPQGQKMSNALFRSIRSLAQNEGEEMIVYVQGCHPDDEFIHFLSSLPEVDTIVLQSESLKVLCESIQPREIYFLEGEELRGYDTAQAMLAALKQGVIRVDF